MSNRQMPIPPGVNPEALENNEQHNLDVANEPERIPEMPPVIPRPVPKRKHTVRATRAGFFQNERKVEGNEFEVESNLTGSWFEYKDPLEQKKHLQRLADKKKNANQRGTDDQRREIADE